MGGMNILAVKDHPRVCGENIGNSSLFLVSKGSPPRVRGKQSQPRSATSVIRITPACAGKTLPSISVLVKLQDHPRVCGENTLASLTFLPYLGSPPRVRGKLDLHGI